jgi:hypothetical protein
MFLRQSISVPVPAAAAQHRLAAYLQLDGLQAASAGAAQDGHRILLAAGCAGLNKQVAVQCAPAYLRGNTTVIALRWVATGPHGDLFPSLDANLELDPAEDGTTTLTLIGSYRPPLGTLGQRLDQFVLHRAAQATVRGFLTRLRGVLIAPETPVTEQPPFGLANPVWLGGAE